MRWLGGGWGGVSEVDRVWEHERGGGVGGRQGITAGMRLWGMDDGMDLCSEDLGLGPGSGFGCQVGDIHWLPYHRAILLAHRLCVSSHQRPMSSHPWPW